MNKAHELVSVMMPAYNAKQFIDQAIESILAQSYLHWELIVVDDGSIDSTASIVAGFDDLRIKLVQQSNGGEAAARNTALRHLNGEFVAFLDADDLYLPNALYDMAAYLNTHPEVGVVFSDGYFCDELGHPLMRISEHRPGPYVGDILEPLILNSSVIGAINTTMVRRSMIENTGVSFDPNLVIGPDWDFFIHLARHAKFEYLDRMTCMYRIHETNVTRIVGRTRRNKDLARGRLKLMNSDWFEELSLTTRHIFFCSLLIQYLSGLPAEQDAIVNSVSFRNLPPTNRAVLLRWIAGDYLRLGTGTEYARKYLSAALELNPQDHKSRVLSSLARQSPSLAQKLFSAWHLVSESTRKIGNVDRSGLRPVPKALIPVDDSISE